MESNPPPSIARPVSDDVFAPTAIYSDGTYIEHNRSWHAEDSPWKALQITRLLGRNQVAPKRVCEVGCGAGDILRELSVAHAESTFVGYELSPQAMDICRAKATDRVSYRMQDIFGDSDLFDCLLCIDVFEHVPDYMGFLEKLRAKATYKVFHVPLDISVLSVVHSSMMHARQSAGHLHYFSHETAAATIRDCGYEIVDAFFTAPFAGLPAKTWKARLAKYPRSALFAMSPSWTAKLLGGCSYLVLAK